jgi:hypothetical protein
MAPVMAPVAAQIRREPHDRSALLGLRSTSQKEMKDLPP